MNKVIKLSDRKVDKVLKAIEDSVVDAGSGFRMSTHPLYHTIWSHEGEDVTGMPEHMQGHFGKPWLRRYITAKLEMLAEAKAKRDWSQYIFIHERPHRCNILYQLVMSNSIPEDQLAKLILEVWSDTEFPHICFEQWAVIFASTTHGRFMAALDKSERGFYGRLPAEVTVYRGIGKETEPSWLAEIGFSWTLNKEKAEWFSHRFGGDGRVVTKVIPKNLLVGPLTGRSEDEMLLIRPWNLEWEGPDE
jgi:hypothetical protein